jgi:23S rRNA (adenine2503-C2)-methyltransferase
MTRQQQFQTLFPNEPRFRFGQIQQALFQPKAKSWDDVTTLSKPMREELAAKIPFISIKDSQVLTSKNGDTYKAMLTLHDGQQIETVLMENARDQWTICVSSQVGCAMRCGFCATGRMGLKRNLTSDEIADQYRFWQTYLADQLATNPKLPQRISNVVFMGMGEPLANYDNVKETINVWLKNTDLGHNHITVSTVGHIPMLEKLLDDEAWPHVRLAVSLHSADASTRKMIVPTSYDGFLEKITDWAKRYIEKFGNKKHHLTFEYVMLRDVNDTPHHAKLLTEFMLNIGHVKVNLIPYNVTENKFKRSLDIVISDFKFYLEDNGVICTVRKTMGDDIAAACGQLIKLGGKPKKEKA